MTGPVLAGPFFSDLVEFIVKLEVFSEDIPLLFYGIIVEQSGPEM